MLPPSDLPPLELHPLSLPIRAPLAQPSDRLLARGLDGVIAILCVTPSIFWVLPAVARVVEGADVPWPVIIEATLLAVVLTVAVSIYQWYLIATTGQTIGKRVAHVRIVRVDDTPVGFVDGVLLREWVMSIIVTVAGLVLTWLPVFGPGASLLVGIVDYLPIFAVDRRCLHDHLAGTKVIAVARPGVP
jgi:uncharacterized RDD family membrane protein YckC